MKRKKHMYIDFYDSNGIFKCSIKNGAALPAGFIVGKGWKTAISFKKIEHFRCGSPCPVHSEECPYND
jgi:hypothetical protein